MADRLVTLRSYTMPWQADLAGARLAAEGIPFFLKDANTVSINWLYSNALGGVKLQVLAADAERARTLLAEVAADPSLPEEGDLPGCPRCRSRQLQKVVRGRIWALVAWLFLGLPLLWPWRRLKCLSCGHVWSAHRGTFPDFHSLQR
ncbi:DUF2007 domain-containing protein [Trichloromonas sp.]|uniref:putative signal transducing protein n=1 Tax=Trichloromonas sp. TaxID=3069249 RepID=UPI003D8137EE